MKKHLILETNKEGYEPNQCGETLTVEELISILEQYKPEMKIYFSNDNGFTYGSIKEENIEEYKEDME